MKKIISVLPLIIAAVGSAVVILHTIFKFYTKEEEELSKTLEYDRVIVISSSISFLFLLMSIIHTLRQIKKDNNGLSGSNPSKIPPRQSGL